MPKRSVSIHRHPCARSPRPRRATWVVGLVAAAVGLSGWATLGSASRRAPEVHAQALPSKRDGALESLRSALARAVLSHGAPPRTTREPEQADDAPPPSDAETTNDEPESELADETESPEEASRPESSDDSDDSTDRTRAFLARLRRWRSWYYRHYRPYWYEGSSDTGSYGAEDDEGPSGGWTIPGGVPLAETEAPSSGQGPTSRCPLDPRRWLVRLQGRPLSAEPGAGLVCLTRAAASSATSERLWLLSGLVRLIARSSPAPQRIALLVHGAALGVLIPPPVDGDPSRLAENLRVLGLGDQDARAAAVVSAFGSRPVGSNHQRQVVAIDPELSLVVMEPRELAGLVASEHDGSDLRRALGVAPISALRETVDELPGEGLVPALPDGTAVGVEFDGCPAQRRPAAPVSRALCIGDGQLVGGREGNRPTMFYEVEASDDPPRSPAT